MIPQEHLSLSILFHCEPDSNEMVGILDEFTNTYQSFSPDEIEAREAACVNVQLKGRVRTIQPGDLFAGRMDQMPIGFTPQSKATGMGYCIHPDIDKMLVSKADLTSESRKILNQAFGMRLKSIKSNILRMQKKQPFILPWNLYLILLPNCAFSIPGRR